MPEYHIRYTCEGELQSSIVNFIIRNSQSCIIAREFATREHIQCYVSTNVVKKTWVNKFNLAFKLDRRDKYVMEDLGKTKQYVCKGVALNEMPDIVNKRGFSDADINEYHQAYWATHIVVEPISFTPTQMTSDKVRKKSMPFMRQVYERLESDYPLREWVETDKPLIFRYVMDDLGRSNRSLDKFIVKRMVLGILNSLMKDHRAEWYTSFYHEVFAEHYQFDNKLRNEENLDFDLS